MRRRLPFLLGAGAYLVALLVIGLWPTHVDDGLNMADRPPTSWLVDVFELSPATAYSVGEFCANVLLFVPAGAFVLGLAPQLRWWRVAIAIGLFSVALELAQAAARPARTAAVSDIVANTIGGALGAGAVALWMHRRSAQRAGVTR